MAGKTPDLKIDGETYEVKTVSGAQGRDVDTRSEVFSNRIMRARGQSGNVILTADGPVTWSR